MAEVKRERWGRPVDDCLGPNDDGDTHKTRAEMQAKMGELAWTNGFVYPASAAPNKSVQARRSRRGGKSEGYRRSRQRMQQDKKERLTRKQDDALE